MPKVHPYFGQIGMVVSGAFFAKKITSTKSFVVQNQIFGQRQGETDDSVENKDFINISI